MFFLAISMPTGQLAWRRAFKLMKRLYWDDKAASKVSDKKEHLWGVYETLRFLWTFHNKSPLLFLLHISFYAEVTNQEEWGFLLYPNATGVQKARSSHLCLNCQWKCRLGAALFNLARPKAPVEKPKNGSSSCSVKDTIITEPLHFSCDHKQEVLQFRIEPSCLQYWAGCEVFNW